MVRARPLELFLSSSRLRCWSLLPAPVDASARIGGPRFKVERGPLAHFVFVLADNRMRGEAGKSVPILKLGERRNLW